MRPLLLLCALAPVAAAAPQVQLAVEPPVHPLDPGQATALAYALVVDVPGPQQVDVHLRGGAADGAVYAWFDPPYHTVGAGRQELAGVVYVRPSSLVPAFVVANLTFEVDVVAVDDHVPIASARVLLPASVAWSPGVSADVAAPHVRIEREGGSAFALADVHNRGNAAQVLDARLLLVPAGCQATIEAPDDWRPQQRAPLRVRLDCAPAWAGGQVVVALVPRLATDPSREGAAVDVLWDVVATDAPMHDARPREFGGRQDAPWGGLVGAMIALVAGASIRRRAP